MVAKKQERKNSIANNIKMAKSREEFPQWVIEEIQTAKFEMPVLLTRTAIFLRFMIKMAKLCSIV